MAASRGPRGPSRARFIPPQLATLVDIAPPGAEWRHEIKYDGYRIEALIEAGAVRLITRNGNDWTDRFPGIARSLGRLPDSILDGEIVALDARGRSSFQRLQQASGPRGEAMAYVAFDLLRQNDEDLRSLPFEERRHRVEQLLRRFRPGRAGAIVRLSTVLPGPGDRALAAACRGGLEGIISKRVDAPYRSGRTRAWLKVKCGLRQEFVVVGYTPPRRSRVALGSLLLGVHEGRALRYAGRVGTGMPTALLRDLLRRLGPITRETPPLADRPARLPPGVRWVEPSLVVEVAFTEWTADGRLRHPALIAVRDDKPAKQVRRERPIRR